MSKTLREKLESRAASLRAKRATFEPAWREIGEQMLPYRLRLDPADRARGERKDSQLLNNAPMRALGTLSAGLHAGVTSPARTWFKLTLDDDELLEVKAVKIYLDAVQEAIEGALQRSQWYSVLSNATYPDLGAFGQAAVLLEEGAPGELRFVDLPLGEYFLDEDADGRVDTCFRELSMTVRQAAQKFGLGKLSHQAQSAWSQGNLEQPVTVWHAIYPNSDHRQGALGASGMAFSSVWWEHGNPDRGVLLRQEGYEEFPVLAPRWTRRIGDVYGRGPGWEARGDCRVLQHREKQLIKMIDKTVDPPMKASGDIKRASLLPGDLTKFEGIGQAGVYEPAMTINPQAIAVLEAHIARDVARIRSAFFADLWQALLDDERAARPTATEVEARRQEVMLMLGPLLGNLDDALLEPCVERAYGILERAGKLPEPPEELADRDLRIQFISIMHQMQQSTGLQGIRAFVGETMALAQARPDALDKLNADVLIDELAKVTGIRPDAVLSRDEVQAVREDRAEAARVREQGEAALAMTQGVKNVGQTNPDNLQQVASMFSPAAAAAGGALGGVTE